MRLIITVTDFKMLVPVGMERLISQDVDMCQHKKSIYWVGMELDGKYGF